MESDSISEKSSFVDDYSLAMSNFGEQLQKKFEGKHVDELEFLRSADIALVAAAVDGQNRRLGSKHLPGFAISLAEGLYNHSDVIIDPTRKSSADWKNIFRWYSATIGMHRTFIANNEDTLHAMIGGDKRTQIRLPRRKVS